MAAKVWSQPRADLGRAWSEGQLPHQARRDQPACAQAELNVWNDVRTQAWRRAWRSIRRKWRLRSSPPAKGRAWRFCVRGCNNQVEMGWAFDTAGFRGHRRA